MDKTSTNEKALMDLKEFMNYTGFKETYARQLIRQPRTGFAIKLGKRWYVHSFGPVIVLHKGESDVECLSESEICGAVIFLMDSEVTLCYDGQEFTAFELF